MSKICVMGLGYVGLPISLILSKYYQTVGFDVNSHRINSLRKKVDVNNQFKKKDFLQKKIFFTNEINEIKKSNFFIICVPTPIDKFKKPNLKYINDSFKILEKIIKKGDIIVLESTVYPGVTQKFTQQLEKKTKMVNNQDFYVCYSPERINPGDKKNELSKIDKILAYDGKSKIIKKKLSLIYSKICKNLILTNKIKEAETAKGIENIQRDLNIALFNEILLISNKLELNFNEIIKLANTKWNFIKFTPGLVGGHCLPVDPYYLTFAAGKKKYKSKVTLAGRSVNESMKKFVLDSISLKLKKIKKIKSKIKICIFGLTYKYGVTDLRNSQNVEIYNLLKKSYKKTSAYDPFLEKFDKKSNYNNLNKFDIYLFLSNGIIYQKIYKKLYFKNRNKILDPFCYYSN